MTKPTKQEVLDCNDVEQLHEWAAIHCMGWAIEGDTIGIPCQIDGTGNIDFDLIPLADWQPCSPSPEGKAQAIELAEKYDMEISFEIGCVSVGDELTTIWFIDKDDRSWPIWKNKNFADTWQIAAVKLAIISEI